MKWNEEYCGSHFLLIELCSFERNFIIVLRGADIRTESGGNEPVGRMDGPEMEEVW
jgi:hypothetical protein